MRTAAALLMMIVLAACAPGEGNCTMIGARPGLGVQVMPDAAKSLSALILEICVGTGCSDHVVTLDPGSVSVDQGCDGPDPDGTCSATAVPDGSLVGFVDVELPAGKIMVGATLTAEGEATTLDRHEFTVAPVYPNGRGCGGEANQATAIIDSTGLR